MADKLEQVAIRMVEQPPLYSNEPMNNPDVAIRVMNEFLSQMDRELFCIVNLQADLTPINMNIVSVGSLNEALINPREIFKSAILSNATSMILLHSHPSGNLNPSREDTVMTDRMLKLSELLGIPLVDHIIVGGKNDSYFSFKEKHVLGYQHNKLESDYNNLVFPTACVAENNLNQNEDMEAEMKVNEEATVRRRRGR